MISSSKFDMRLLNVFCFRIRTTETEEKRHEREYDGRPFHGTKEKVIIIIFLNVFLQILHVS